MPSLTVAILTLPLMMSEITNENLLSVKDLRVHFHSEEGTVKAVDGISFELKRGETLGIVGESGSGKSVANLSLMRLIPEPPGKIVSGEILFRPHDVLELSLPEMRVRRQELSAMILFYTMSLL